MAIKKGDKIKVDYTGTLDDGTVFDTSTHGDHAHPLEFTVGAGQLIKGFDEAVVGMNKGDEKSFSIPSKEAYGDRNDELIKQLPRQGIPAEAKPGMILGLRAPDGRQFPATIVALDDKNVTLDLNHPLAGKKLNFKIKIVEC